MKRNKSWNVIQYLLVWILIISNFSIVSYADIVPEPTETDIVVEVRTELKTDQSVTVDFTSPKEGYYYVGLDYKATDVSFEKIEFELMIDQSFPDESAKNLVLPRMWMNSESRTDMMGNEFAPRQIPYDDFCFNHVYVSDVNHSEKYRIRIGQGQHTATLHLKSGEMEVSSLKFGATKEIAGYREPKDSQKYYSGEPIILEGEDACIKSSYFLSGKTDASTVRVSPYSAEKNVVNFIGGGNWKSEGDTLFWKTPELKEGYYQIGFSFRQNAIIGGKTYRCLEIDHKVPFKQAEEVGFSYDDSWQNSYFADEEGNPYLVYFSQGSHLISLSVTSGEIEKVRNILSKAVSDLGALYVDITMITGDNVDMYRDYDLFSQIADMEDRLKTIKTDLNSAAESLKEITGQKSGSHYSVIKNMVQVINQMLDNRYDAHRYKSYYYTNYCSVSSVLQELRNMPLDLDKIALTAVGQEKPFDMPSFFEQMKFSVKRFLVTFVKDYNSVSSATGKKAITVWVNWGRDQAQVLSSLIHSSFVAETGINVNLQLVNASMVQAVLSGNGPDCFLQHARSEPVNLAMRGVLYDLSQFDDCEQVLKRFQEGADIPYRYNGGLYALPDTQNFFMMFYRTDILKQLNLPVPKTWNEFNRVSKILLQNNMSVWLPNNKATDAAQVNAGVGSNNIFPTLLLQNGISLYDDDGKQTNLLSSEAMEVFELWTDYYRKMKFPVTLDFYNRFRTGTTPLGISTYSLYTTLKVAAPEIDGLWEFSALPGVETGDGNIVNYSSGGGTGCAILKSSENPDLAWEFLKWWTREDTQLSFSNDVESILGPAGRVTLSNVEAIKGLQWDDGMLDRLLEAWENVREIPEYPGSYYVSRSIYQSFWNVVNDSQNPKDMMMKYAKEANDEMARKWKQYTNRR